MKSTISGFLVGILLATGVTVFGFGSNMVEVYLQDKMSKIQVDGSVIELAEDTHILNYEGRIYTPARLVAEELGAEVVWDADRNTVVIDSKLPETEIVKETVEVKVPMYSELPVRREKDRLSINLAKYSRDGVDILFGFDYENNFGRSVQFRPDYSYVEIDGEKHNYVNVSDGLDRQNLKSNELVKGAYITFSDVPEKVREMKVVLSFDYFKNTGDLENFDFIFYVSLDEVDYIE